MKKNVFLLFLLLSMTINVFAADKQPEKPQITDVGSYVARLMELSAEGDSNSWLVIEAFASQMNEGSPIFKAIAREAEKNNDRAKLLIGKFYLAKGKNEDAIRWLGKITNERYRNARFMLATALMNKAKRTSDELYFAGAVEILNELKNIKVEVLSNTESIDFLLKACEKGSDERKIFMQLDSVK